MIAWVTTPAQHLTELHRDVVYALRRLAKSPGFAFVGIISLSLGIGVCSVYFSEINSLLLRPLPGARDPGALVAFDAPSSYPYFERYRDQKGVAAAATAFIGPVPFGVALRDRDATKERVFGHLVSPEYFSTLGVEPALGRFFRADEEKPGTSPVVVVSDRFWRTRLHADPRVVGRILGLNGKSAIIVGVGPKDFLGVWPLAPADLFVPVTSGSSIAPELGDAPPRRDLVAEMYPLENRDLAPQVGGDALHNRNLAIFSPHISQAGLRGQVCATGANSRRPFLN
ncbi:MAG: ABC transporter permease [Bryobacteraceae bacterium]